MNRGNLIYKFSFQCRHITRNIVNNVGIESEAKTLDTKVYAEFKKRLKAHSIPYKDGYTCLQLPCQLCKRDTASSMRTLAYVNKRTGDFLCSMCDVKVPLTRAKEVYENPEQKFQQVEIEYKTKYQNLANVTQSVCDQLGLKGLKVEQLASLGAQYDSEKDLLHFYLKNASKVIVGEKVLHLSDKTEETHQVTTQTSLSGILLHGRVNNNKAVLVSNLLDFIALASQNLENYSIVCLPLGLRHLPQECLPALEQFKELVLWFNYETSEWDAARSFANKLNDNRCLLIRPTETEPSPKVAWRKRLNIRHILAKATPVLHKSITTFSALRNDILSELQNIEKVNGVKWKRFPLLNKLLKGHRKGELTILTGPTGSGKTTFMCEYSLDLVLQGVPTLWGSFEIRNTRLASTMLRQYVGYSLENKLNEFDHWASRFEKLPIYFMTFHGQQPLKVVMEAVKHAQYIHDITHVVIDNLQFMMGTAASYRTDKFWEQDAIISSFRTFATKLNVHVTLVMHPRKERQEDDLTTSSVFGTAKATQEADNVLIIQDKRLTSLRGKKYLQIAKNRYSGDLGIMPLDFDKDALSYAMGALSAKKKREKDKDQIQDKFL